MHTKLSFVVVFTFFLLIDIVHGQLVDDRAVALTATQAMMDRLRSYVDSKASGNLKVENQRVFINIVDSMEPSMSASIDKNKRHIVTITNEFTVLLMYLTETEILAEVKGETQCELAYGDYISEKLNQIAYARDSRTSMPTILAPEIFGNHNGGACMFLNKYYPFSADLRNVRTKSVASNVEFLYLHELAHHILGHTSNGVPNIDSGEFYSQSYIHEHMAQLRTMETAADLWAVDQMFFLGDDEATINPPLYNLFIASSGFDPQDEEFATHPLGLRRELDILIRHKEDYLKKYGSYRGYPERFDQARLDAAALLHKAEQKYGGLRGKCFECTRVKPQDSISNNNNSIDSEGLY